MHYSQIRSFVAIWVALVMVLSTLSCSSGMITPKRGLTNQFFREAEGQIVPLDTYDFSRLDQGYGICIFSYEFSGKKGNRIIGFKEQEEKGMRVWEYRFEQEGWDVKWLEKRMSIWGFRTATTLFLTKETAKVTVRLPFHRGRIVYAGRLIVKWPTYLRDGPSVEFHFEDDMGPWLEQFASRGESVKVDSVSMGAGY